MAVQLTQERPRSDSEDATARIALLARLAREMASLPDPRASLDLLLPELARVLNVAAVAVVDCEGAQGGLRVRSAYGLPQALPGAALNGSDTMQVGPGAVANIDWGIEVDAAQWMPLAASGGWFGALVAFNPRDRAEFNRTDLDLLETVSRMAALAESRCAREADDPAVIRGELELAAEIQRNLLPSWRPAELPVHGINRPARTVSGDFYDYLSLPCGRIPFALGDVSGKGMNAALMMTKTVSLFRYLAKSIYDPAMLLQALNEELCDTATRGMFVTMVAGIYEPVSGCLRFANAGHEPPLLRSAPGDYRQFPAAAPPLGITRDLMIDDTEIQIGEGEFYIFSDGLTEFGYGENEFLGVKGLKQMIEGLGHEPLATRMESLLGELDRQGWEARDDLTVLTIDGSWVKHDA